MKLRIVVVGRMRGLLAPAVEEYETRAGRYWNLEITEVDAGTGRGGDVPADRVREIEAARLRDRLPDRGEVWALTREGKELSSEALARTLGERALAGSPGIAFLIGGAYGLASSLVRDADRKLSLSRMTLPHAVARLVLAEQLYRAGTILRNEPYHKGRA